MSRLLLPVVLGLLGAAFFAGALRDQGAPEPLPAPPPPEPETLPSPTPAPPPPAPEEARPPPRAAARPPCLQGLPGAARALEGLDLDRSLTLHRAMKKNVTFDNRTVLAALALAQATRTPLKVEEVTNHTLERLDLCSFEARAGEGNATVSLRRVVLFHTIVRHNATLDPAVALRAIALHAGGVPVDARKVVTFVHHESTRRVFEQAVDVDEGVAAVALRALLARGEGSGTPGGPDALP